MDTARYLRTHSTIVFNRRRGLAALVSPGYAWRFQQEQKAAARRAERNREYSPDNPALSPSRRLELRKALGLTT